MSNLPSRAVSRMTLSFLNSLFHSLTLKLGWRDRALGGDCFKTWYSADAKLMFRKWEAGDKVERGETDIEATYPSASL